MTTKCRFRKKGGKICDADTQSGKTVCIFHDPSKAADGERARRAGGLSRSRPAAVLSPETPPKSLRDSLEVSALLGESINQVLRGQLDPRVANAVGYLSGILLRALEQGPMEERLTRLEASLGLALNTRTSNVQKENEKHADRIVAEKN